MHESPVPVGCIFCRSARITEAAANDEKEKQKSLDVDSMDVDLMDVDLIVATELAKSLAKSQAAEAALPAEIPQIAGTLVSTK